MCLLLDRPLTSPLKMSEPLNAFRTRAVQGLLWRGGTGLEPCAFIRGAIGSRVLQSDGDQIRIESPQPPVLIFTGGSSGYSDLHWLPVHGNWIRVELPAAQRNERESPPVSLAGLLL